MYIPISKKFFDKTLKNGLNLFEQQLKLIQNLKSIGSIIDLTHEEIEILEKSNRILMNKLEHIEDLIECEDNTFYDSENNYL